MNNKEYGKLAELTMKITNMTFILKSYCKVSFLSSRKNLQLVEFTKLIDKKALELYGLL